MKNHRKSEVLRARVHPQLKDDIFKVARIRHLDTSDIIRIACADYVASFKRKLATLDA